jgi:hypothetical protein
MKTKILEAEDDKYRLQAWRIRRAWKQVLGIELNMDRLIAHLRDMAGRFSAPTPLVDKVLAEIEAGENSAVVILAELKKEPDGDRARRGGAHDKADSESTIDNVFED